MIIIYHTFRYWLTNDSALRLKSMPKYFVLFRFFPFNFTFFWKRPPTSFLIFPVFSTFVVLLWVDKHLELNDHLAAALLCSNASKRVTKNFKLGCMKRRCAVQTGVKSSKMLGKMFFLSRFSACRKNRLISPGKLTDYYPIATL